MASTLAGTASLTPTQQRAVAARGNVLVMAGAGTGKTRTLVERCLDCIEDGAAVDELLVVTFTEAAAAEMRGRLRRAMEARSEADTTGVWAGQLARFDLAHIGTLHSFCLKLVREHFYELGLDPRLTVSDEGQARQLASETLAEQFAGHYAGEDDFSRAVQNLIQLHGGGRDEPISRLVWQLHQHSQARPDAAGWLARQREMFSAVEPADWRGRLLEAVAGWRDEWLPVLENLRHGNEKARELAAVLSRLAAEGFTRQTAAEVFGQVVAANDHWPARRKTVLRKPIGDIFEEAAFLRSLAEVKADGDPLAEDWSWIRGPMDTLLRLAGEFAQKLAERKQAAGVLDFHDLEQMALRLLWDFSTDRPTAVARQWRAALKFVFVDEYQDINAAQDQIITALSREGAEANRFLVGDLKQGIYRFRLADPKIFRDYARRWRGGAGGTIPLTENFRSRAGLLRLVNSLFGRIMREETGGVAYDAEAELKFGSPETRGGPGPAGGAIPCAELLLRFKSGRHEIGEDEDGQTANADDAEREARLVAWRLKQLVALGQKIFDEETKRLRRVEWRDIAILLRSPRGRAEIFAKVFERAGVPLAVARGGFYESAEILDLLSLLQLLDNPLQDVPCLAVLRSPLAGLSLDELAQIRLAARDRHFWTALNRSAERGLGEAGTAAKIAQFLERFSRWRAQARLVPLSQCLESVLTETYYAEWLRAQPRGAQRAANVAGFLRLARQFDQFQRQGLFRFLQFIEAQQEAEAEPEVPATATENAVRLMSIHQSKGLEFPLVVLADLAKRFNEQDLRGDLIFDEEAGLCPRVRPPHGGQGYPSLTHWLAQRRQKRELRGEELRLLYVALTRARDHLILTATVAQKDWDETWRRSDPPDNRAIAGAKSFADWLALWFSVQLQDPKTRSPAATEGTFDSLRWRLVADSELEDAPGVNEAPAETGGRPEEVASHGEALKELRTRLEWSYPFVAATRTKAKSSVTALRREADELDDEAQPIFSEGRTVQKLKPETGVRRLSAPEIGAAHHKFLEHLALDRTDDLAAEADRLRRENYLSAAERAELDLAALGAFWNSALGRKIRAHADEVRRELPFTARFSPAELAEITGAETGAGLAGEFVIVQGVADLVVLRPHEIWLVDFKTDELAAGGLPGKIKIYSPQLRLYALALERIFARPVTLRAVHFLAARRTEEI